MTHLLASLAHGVVSSRCGKHLLASHLPILFPLSMSFFIFLTFFFTTFSPLHTGLLFAYFFTLVNFFYFQQFLFLFVQL